MPTTMLSRITVHWLDAVAYPGTHGMERSTNVGYTEDGVHKGARFVGHGWTPGLALNHLREIRAAMPTRNPRT